MIYKKRAARIQDHVFRLMAVLVAVGLSRKGSLFLRNAIDDTQ